MTSALVPLLSGRDCVAGTGKVDGEAADVAKTLFLDRTVEARISAAERGKGTSKGVTVAL